MTGTRTVYSLLEEAVASFGNSPALYEPVTGRSRGEAKTWKAYTWIEYKQAADEIAAGLWKLGVKPGDIVALDSETRLEFYLADLGTMACGGVAAALYTSYPPAEHVKTLRDLAPKVTFVENPKALGALQSAAEPPLDTQWVLLSGEADGAKTLEQLRELGRWALGAKPGLLEVLKERSAPAIPPCCTSPREQLANPKWAE
jgi:long-chain acyl-CoA synthetase